MLQLLIVVGRTLALGVRGHRELVLDNLALRQRRVARMAVAEVVSAPASPWQNPFVERVIGSIRRECLDHVIVLNETHLRRVLSSYPPYYHRTRTHLGLDKDTPDRRPIAATSAGPIIVVPEVGGLHHRYERRAP